MVIYQASFSFDLLEQQLDLKSCSRGSFGVPVVVVGSGAETARLLELFQCECANFEGLGEHEKGTERSVYV